MPAKIRPTSPRGIIPRSDSQTISIVVAGCSARSCRAIFSRWAVSAHFIPHEPTLAHIFIGATLCATSVGITARVFKDLGKLNTREARIILGAAVIDDVLGLLILAIVVVANHDRRLMDLTRRESVADKKIKQSYKNRS